MRHPDVLGHFLPALCSPLPASASFAARARPGALELPHPQPGEEACVIRNNCVALNVVVFFDGQSGVDKE